MSDLVGNPEDRFSRVEAHLDSSNGKLVKQNSSNESLARTPSRIYKISSEKKILEGLLKEEIIDTIADAGVLSV